MAKADTEMPTMEKTSSKNDDKTSGSSPLRQFFIDALKDIYYAETVLTEAMGRFEKASTTEELREAFEDDQAESQKHLKRLERVFQIFDETPAKKTCEGINGIIKEAEEIIKSTPEGSMTRDAALIIAAQKAEHYEIATYGGLVQLALTMGENKAASILERTLEEEENTDQNLTEIAEMFINFDAERED